MRRKDIILIIDVFFFCNSDRDLGSIVNIMLFVLDIKLERLKGIEFGFGYFIFDILIVSFEG